MEDVRTAEPFPDEVADALAELTGALVDASGLEVLLQRVADLVLVTVQRCAAASVTLLDAGSPRTAAHTGPIALELDQAQYDLDAGPCLDAARHLRTTRVDLAEADDRWPEFTARAVGLGVTSFLATPLVAGGRSVGALNLFSTDPGGFGELDEALVDLFCARASVALANARLYAQAVAVGAQMAEAMRSRAVIEQAKGVLMATSRVDADVAFAALTARSQRENRKLRDVVRACATRPQP